MTHLREKVCFSAKLFLLLRCCVVLDCRDVGAHAMPVLMLMHMLALASISMLTLMLMRDEMSWC
jgi:hypothetical protein